MATMCPDCHGRRGHRVVVLYADGSCRGVYQPCATCGDHGEVTEALAAELANYKAQGDWLRAERKADPYETLGDVARRWGVSPAVVSGLEFGQLGIWREWLAAQETG